MPNTPKLPEGWSEIIDYDSDNIWHVEPVNDLKKHLDLMACWCNPKIQVQENKGLLVIHNSLDMREYQKGQK